MLKRNFSWNVSGVNTSGENMSQFILHDIDRFVKFFLNLQSEIGQVALAYGKQQLHFKTQFTPREIWLNIAERGLPVCNPELPSMASAKITVDGFILSANVTANACDIAWYIIY